ncbi:unnamed protein product, partial [Mesorhabditis belari]|uniref:Suppressor of cytokine signaling 5 n=1 Tax=Mesorhabditis belari TaxID=2138241 RepID=A0AAF3E8H7_9BILA
MNPTFPRNWSHPQQIEPQPSSYAPPSVVIASTENLLILEEDDRGSNSNRLRSSDHQGVSGSSDCDLFVTDFPCRRQYDLHKSLRKSRTTRKKASLKGVITSVSSRMGHFLFGETSTSQPNENEESDSDLNNQESTRSDIEEPSLQCPVTSTNAGTNNRMPKSSLFCPCFSPMVSEDSDEEEERDAFSMLSISREMRQQFALRADSTRHPTEYRRSLREEQPIVHRTVEYANFFVKDMEKVLSASYYWGIMDRFEAERLLEGKPEGTFLLRDSAQTAYLFSVSFRRYQRTLHARIEQENHRFGFDIHDPSVFSSDRVTKLIDNYKDPTRCLFFEPLLTTPLKRDHVFSLQEICRATISSHCPYDQVSKLPLPNNLKNFVRDFHYIHPVRTTFHENS